METCKQHLDISSIVESFTQKRQLCQWDEIESVCRQFLNDNPLEQATAESWDESSRFIICSLGEALAKQQKFNEAVWLYKKAIEIDSTFPGFQSGLGATYKEQGQWEDAVQCHRSAIDLRPDSPELYVSLGEILANNMQPEEAISAYRQAISLQPDWAITHYLLGNALADTGQIEEAIASYRKALDIEPNFSVARFGICIKQLPIIYSSAEELNDRRNQYKDCLENLAQHYHSATPKELAASVEVIGSLQPFYLAYQGVNDRELQQQYGQLMGKIMSSRYPQWSQPIDFPPLKPNEKIRVGFVSGFFYNHSNWKIPIRGWAENLNKSEFELFGYHTGPIKDAETVTAAKVFDKFCQGNFSFSEWAERIQQDRLHILIFPEFGMDPVTVRLGCLRLAPVQATSWGHPTTSGLPTIDYYLSSDLMEPSNAQEHYTEKLLRLPNLSIHYRPLNLEPVYQKRSDLGIESDEIVYWCCQSLYKYLPQHDDVFPRIAQELPSAKFVFIEHMSERVTQTFRQRLSQAFRALNLNYEDFCIFIERLTPAEFAGISASIADVFLDSIGWSGCNSTLESIAHDLPIVTLSGELMRGRHTMAILEMLGLQEVIAPTKEDYLKIAIQLGTNAEFRTQVSQKISANKHKLYGDLAPVRALEDFFRQVAGKTQNEGAALVAEALQQASELCRRNQLSQAEQIYRVLLVQCPHQADALLGLGLLLQRRQQFPEAEKLLCQAVQHLPHSVKTWFSLGNLYLTQENFSQAAAAYRQALALRPDAVSIYNNLGFALQNQGLWEEAIASYRQALEIQPTCAEAEANLGNALHVQGGLQSSQIEYYANLNYRLGKAQQAKGQASVALSYFRHAMALQPSFAEAEVALGVCLRDSENRLEEALRHFLNAQAAQPEDLPMVYVELGRTYQMQGKIREAVSVFRDYLRLINPLYAERTGGVSNRFPDSDPDPNLEQYQPPAITFSEVTVGDYGFPAIPPVEETAHRPFWSVVIPAVNRPEYFPECLASVLAQWSGDADMEILVLDNGSDPPLFDIVDGLGQGIIRYVRLPQTIPLQENWNTMVALARGEWIFLLQHDDYVLSGFFEQLREGLENCPESVGAAFTNYENIDEKRNVVFSQSYGLGQYRGVVKDWIKQIGVSNPTSPPSLVIRRTAYEAVGGYKLDLPYTCDWEFYMRVAAAFDWWHEPSLLAHYRQYSNSLTLKDSLNGVSGTAHRQAIEIAQTYIPPQWREEITQKSRAFHFEWCMDRAIVAMQHEAWFGAMKLAQEALLIDPSEEASEKFLSWMNAIEMKPLKTEFSRKLFGDNHPNNADWTTGTIKLIRRIEL